jgi:N-acylneuraminate cytidylyltransferase
MPRASVARAQRRPAGRVVALVPLRGGSKSIPRKNVKPIAGRPLCAWAISAALSTPGIDEVWVSTEDAAIAEAARAADERVRVLDRPAALARDESSTESVMLHFAKEVEFDWLVTLQATSPLTTAEDLGRALDRVARERLDSLLTGVRLKRFLWSDEGKPLNYEPRRRPRRQEFDGTRMENGAFYVTSRKVLTREKCRLGGRVGFFEMDPATAVEIDEPADWAEVEAALLSRGELAATLRGVRGIAMDVDGVLTDGAMYYGPTGEAMKRFDTRDGHGLKKVMAAGVKVAFVTREPTTFAKARADKLGIPDVVSGSLDKGATIDDLAGRWGVPLANLAFVGDDEVDLPAMRRVGLPAAPSDAMPVARAAARYVTRATGGHGAIRELCEAILRARGLVSAAPDAGRTGADGGAA